MSQEKQRMVNQEESTKIRVRERDAPPNGFGNFVKLLNAINIYIYIYIYIFAKRYKYIYLFEYYGILAVKYC
jgi:hypothetical protein